MNLRVARKVYKRWWINRRLRPGLIRRKLSRSGKSIAHTDFERACNRIDKHPIWWDWFPGSA